MPVGYIDLMSICRWFDAVPALITPGNSAHFLFLFLRIADNAPLPSDHMGMLCETL